MIFKDMKKGEAKELIQQSIRWTNTPSPNIDSPDFKTLNKYRGSIDAAEFSALVINEAVNVVNKRNLKSFHSTN